MTRSEETSFDTQHPWEPLGATDPRDLTLPLYGATFGQAVARFFHSYARFSGRASRSEYWWPQLAFLLALLICGVFIAVAGDNGPLGGLALVIAGIIMLGCVIPGWALLVRRLHDANLSGWMCLLTLLPYVGLVFGLLPSKPHGQRFDRRPSQ
ncbi:MULTISPECIES: DUF805 domain-containing protein [Mycobacterium]|uniref:DUF805 domain-containing protein n=1 Tax=Mycobacterium syngnathidarum TaxID=1908205 RepID=A0A1Q9WCC7_9MYCO|nr:MULTISPECIES: DUF805 domain-containing protein [Mycobacterium]MCG7607001.1 DUF805 domain-containing protein [Mycobacterium sp. CnD-18-1]OHU07533.1 hypothetical protein BKG61_03120 [Mycobacterium syngnathidarum]OLT96467.1 hypothetical protein BKG60_10835 [Mycobacterium syngnathidarum]